MYQTNQNLYQFFPSLLTEEQQKECNEIVAKNKEYEQRKKIITAPYYKAMEEQRKNGKSPTIFSTRDDYPDKEVEALRKEMDMQGLREREIKLHNEFFPTFINSYNKEYGNVEEAFVAYIKDAIRIFAWFKDVKAHQEDLVSQGKDSYFTQAASNYWYYMEWQSDFFHIGEVLYALNGYKIPENQGFTNFDLYHALGIICGCEDASGKGVEYLLSRLEKAITTAAAWAYDDEENSWILKGKYPNTQQQGFVEHMENWVAMYKFLKKENPSVDLVQKAIYFKPMELRERAVFKEVVKKYPVVAIKNLEEFAQSIIDAIVVNKDWLNINKVVEKNEDGTDNFYFTQLGENLYCLGVALIALKQKYPNLVIWNSNEFTQSIEIVREFGKPFVLMEYMLNFIDLTGKHIEYILQKIVFKDVPGESAEKLYSLMKALNDYSHHLREADMDVVQLKKTKHREYLGTSVDMEDLSKYLLLVEEEPYEPDFLARYQKGLVDKT